MKKYLKPAIALVLVAALAIGGTLAYLTDVTDEKVNEFTVDKKVDIELTETDQPWELIPNERFDKDPTITIVEDESYVFTEVVETLPTKAFTMGTVNTDDDRDFTDYVIYEINGLYEANSTVGDPTTAGGTIYRADDTDYSDGIDWYWMLIETAITSDPVIYTGSTADTYTTVTYKLALVDEYGKLLEVSSTDMMVNPLYATDATKDQYIAAEFPILLNDEVKIADLTQEDLALFASTDITVANSNPVEYINYSADLAFQGYAIQTSGLDDLTDIADIYDEAAAGTTVIDQTA